MTSSILHRSYQADPAVRVGALAVLADIVEDDQVRRHFPALVKAAGSVGSVQIRNRSTLASYRRTAR